MSLKLIEHFDVSVFVEAVIPVVTSHILLLLLLDSGRSKGLGLNFHFAFGHANKLTDKSGLVDGDVPMLIFYNIMSIFLLYFSQFCH